MASQTQLSKLCRARLKLLERADRGPNCRHRSLQRFPCKNASLDAAFGPPYQLP